jgi:hypothetical protein
MLRMALVIMQRSDPVKRRLPDGCRKAWKPRIELQSDLGCHVYTQAECDHTAASRDNASTCSPRGQNK